MATEQQQQQHGGPPDLVADVLRDQQHLTIDVHKYFARIGLSAASVDDFVPTLENLRRLQNHHLKSIPFESYDVALKGGVSIQLQNVFDKLVCSQRGGYCFEQNQLLAKVLQQLGYVVELKLARVLNATNMETNVLGRRVPTHQTLVVVFGDDSRWLCDVGFGGFNPPYPIKIEEQECLVQYCDEFRLKQRSNSIGQWDLYQRLHGGCGGEAAATEEAGYDGWCMRYTFDDRYSCEPVDFILPNHWCATAMDSTFLRIHWAAITLDGGRCALWNNKLTTTMVNADDQHKSPEITEREMTSWQEWQEALSSIFGISLTDEEATRLFRKGAST